MTVHELPRLWQSLWRNATFVQFEALKAARERRRILVLRVGLNPYGISYAVGLTGAGTSKENPRPLGLHGFVRLAEEIGARSIELHGGHLFELERETLERLKERLAEKEVCPIVSVGPPMDGLDQAIVCACALAAKIVRVGLTTVLCGDRAELGSDWSLLVRQVRKTLCERARQAADLGIALAIEDHQDFGSRELLDFANEAGTNVGICLDTGNPLAVGEEPISFARRVAPRVRHVHMKDYQAQWTDQGYRLVRCAIGDGAIPFVELARILSEHHSELTASIELGALEARHIRLFQPRWWQGYPERSAADLGSCLAAARVRLLEETAEWRTPWEKNAGPQEIVDYELGQLRKSVAHLKAMGLM